MGGHKRDARLARMLPVLVLAMAAAGCSYDSFQESLPSMPKLNDLNPFAEKPKPLPGRRVAIMQASEKVPSELAPADKPIALPPARVNETWSQPGGQPNNAPGHLALASAVRQTWSTDAGAGSTSAAKLTASPVIYEGRIFTLDSLAQVRSFSAGGGAASWRVSLVPEKAVERAGFGGGLAADGGRIYAATGFGTVVALEPATGKKLWEKQLGIPVRASPTAAADRVFVVTTDGRVFCLAGVDGAELWTFRGLPEQASLISNPSPAVEQDMVVVPYPSGEVIALKITDGQQVWSESLSRTRSTTAMATLSDAARPVIDGGTVFAIGHGGRMIATQQKTGERLWSINVPGTQPPWVAGELVYVVDTQGQLIAVTRRDGKTVWTSQLPGPATWTGPTLAGGQLWLVSNKGQLVGVEAATGKVATQLNLGAPAFIAPVVAQGRMYVLTDTARLIALN
jgi:outer membrane protein assembly factor BamB